MTQLYLGAWKKKWEEPGALLTNGIHSLHVCVCGGGGAGDVVTGSWKGPGYPPTSCVPEDGLDLLLLPTLPLDGKISGMCHHAYLCTSEN